MFYRTRYSGDAISEKRIANTTDQQIMHQSVAQRYNSMGIEQIYPGPHNEESDLSECASYQMVSLVNYIRIILTMVLPNGLKQQVQLYLSAEQVGFREDRNTTHQILKVILIAEKGKRNGKKAYS